MSEAKPQDGTTVKGYRTLGPKEIEEMNELKKVSREFCQLLEKQKAWVQDELSATGNHSSWPLFVDCSYQDARSLYVGMPICCPT